MFLRLPVKACLKVAPVFQLVYNGCLRGVLALGRREGAIGIKSLVKVWLVKIGESVNLHQTTNYRCKGFFFYILC